MKIPIFYGIYQERWGFSWAMLVYQRVYNIFCTLYEIYGFFFLSLQFSKFMLFFGTNGALKNLQSKCQVSTDVKHHQIVIMAKKPPWSLRCGSNERKLGSFAGPGRKFSPKSQEFILENLEDFLSVAVCIF